MDDALKAESEKLARSWQQHDSEWLRSYLVSSVEDPRINLQSIISRHFLVRALFEERYLWLMHQEYRFGAAMNWLTRLAQRASEDDELRIVLIALQRGFDNAEGMHIPTFLAQIFASLPAQFEGLKIPNYVESFLIETKIIEGKPQPDPRSLQTFQQLWSNVFRGPRPATGHTTSPRFSVLEPACGSANDYRFLYSYGIAECLDYTGIDLSSKNVENARALFPDVRFQSGNVFEIPSENEQFDYSFVHDLFEHLSPAGLNAAVTEICRVTRLGLCAGFFNMDELPEHIIQPVEDYHWNRLSLARIRELFKRHGFTGQILHIGTFLRQQLGCEETHNPNAYTFLLWRKPEKSTRA